MTIYLDMMRLVKYQHFFHVLAISSPVKTIPSFFHSYSHSQLGVCILTYFVVLYVVHYLYAPIGTTTLQVCIQHLAQRPSSSRQHGFLLPITKIGLRIMTTFLWLRITFLNRSNHSERLLKHIFTTASSHLHVDGGKSITQCLYFWGIIIKEQLFMEFKLVRTCVGSKYLVYVFPWFV